MDSDWVFNFNCSQKPLNSSKYYDEQIIPAPFYEAVMNRNKPGLINQFKKNPTLLKQVTEFYFNTLANYNRLYRTSKFGMPFKIRWSLKNQESITMNNIELVLFYNYITLRKPFLSNFGYLLSQIYSYTGLLKQAHQLIKKKQSACCYYYLGNNISNNFQMEQFIKSVIIY